MEKLPQYMQVIQEGKTLLDNHTKLLESLLLSRQENDNSLYTYEETDGSTDVSFESGEGFNSPGDGASA
jgi:hypothetical protein